MSAAGYSYERNPRHHWEDPSRAGLALCGVRRGGCRLMGPPGEPRLTVEETGQVLCGLAFHAGMLEAEVELYRWLNTPSEEPWDLKCRCGHFHDRWTNKGKPGFGGTPFNRCNDCKCRRYRAQKGTT